MKCKVKMGANVGRRAGLIESGECIRHQVERLRYRLSEFVVPGLSFPHASSPFQALIAKPRLALYNN